MTDRETNEEICPLLSPGDAATNYHSSAGQNETLTISLDNKARGREVDNQSVRLVEESPLPLDDEDRAALLGAGQAPDVDEDGRSPRDEENSRTPVRPRLPSELPFTGCPSSNETSRWGVVCVLVIAFLQVFSSRELGTVVGKHDREIFHLGSAEQQVIIMSFGAVMYTFPILAGLICDTLVSRHVALPLILGLKLVGSVITFVAHFLVKPSLKPSEKMVQLLFYVNIIGVAFIVVALCFFALLLSFGAQQVNQTSRKSGASFFRGLAIVICVSVIMQDAVHMLGIDHVIPLQSPLVIGDVLSLIVFLVGWKKYNKCNSNAGRQRFKEFVKIVQTYIPLCPKRRTNEVYDPFDENLQHDRIEKRALDRLHLKKAILLMAILSFGAVAMSGVYLVGASLSLIQNDMPRKASHKFGIVRGGAYLTFFLTILLKAILARWSRRCRKVIDKNPLKKLGLGSLLSAFANLIVGIISTALWVYGAEQISVYWLWPQFMIVGVGAVFILLAVIEIAFFESGPGLSTTVCALGASLSFISVTASAAVFYKIDIESIKKFDYIYYIMFGVVMTTLLIIYTPVSVWYTRVKVKLWLRSLTSREHQENELEGVVRNDTS